MSKKVCKNCKLIVEQSECPLCKGNQFSTTWQGRINVLDPLKSKIAKNVKLTAKGEYVVKVR
ncbi:DNA-directed RNA polymerase subunit E'' [Candidatus Woesearchaeota archaeon]|nr:DNA-directed RNA polymerase subunit E'' [Candidatus Woesearchaeota archaeon]